MSGKEIEIEVEDDNDDEKEEKEENEVLSDAKVKPKRINITKKKTKELTEDEKKQILEDARNGIENEFFEVKSTKTGKPRIVVRRTTLSEQFIREANESQPRELPRKYITDNQLLLEHVINLETSFNKLRSKHKKLKKRYNELEGYLYNDNDDDDNDNDEAPKTNLSQTEKQQNNINEQPQEQEPPQQPQPQPQQVQYRYVKSWRQLGNQ